METVGERIKRLRKETNLTQAELAQKLGIEPPAISKYETDRVPVPIEQLNKLADIFNVTTDYILCRTDNPKPVKKDQLDEPLQIAASMKNGLDLSDMSEHDKEIIRNLVESMKNKGK